MQIFRRIVGNRRSGTNKLRASEEGYPINRNADLEMNDMRGGALWQDMIDGDFAVGAKPKRCRYVAATPSWAAATPRQMVTKSQQANRGFNLV